MRTAERESGIILRGRKNAPSEIAEFVDRIVGQWNTSDALSFGHRAESATLRAAHDRATEMIQIRLRPPDARTVFGSPIHRMRGVKPAIARGGNVPEDAFQWRNTVKAIVHIADASAHGQRFAGIPITAPRTP
jgi:hypothetical protein